MKAIFLLTLVVVLILSAIPTAHAEWQLDGNAITNNVGGAFLSSMIPDGSGGAILAWQDYRNGSNDIFVQRVSANGVPLWTADGVAMCIAAGDQSYPTLVSDGAGGAIVTWQDARTGIEDIYARRVTSTGVAQWAADGVALCTATGGQYLPTIVSDNAGGAIIVWRDARTPANGYDIYARRVNAAGTPQWIANGVAVCIALGGQVSPQLVVDGAGGAVMTWEDFRNGSHYDIFAQKLNALGAPQWAGNGVPVCTAADQQYNPNIVTDGAAGAIIAWHDQRSGPNYDVYAQRLNAAGVPQWINQGNEICIETGLQHEVTMTSDGVGGAIIAWHDSRGGNYDIYAQRVAGGGNNMWFLGGVLVCIAVGEQITPVIVPDGAAGAIVAWQDTRFGNDDLYARRILASGQLIWTFDGSPVSTAYGDQEYPLMASDGAGGAIVGWSDSRSWTQVYAQRAEPRYGTWGYPEPTVVSATDNPSDQGGYVILRWIASEHDRFYYPGVSHYSVWRTTDAFATIALTSNVTVVTDPTQIDEDFQGSAIWEQPTAAGPLYWEWVANQNAFYSQSYSYLTPTRQDSIAGVPAPHHFKVIAHEANFPQTRAWESGTVSGSSHDNLAPPAPLALDGNPTPWDITLHWTSGGVVEDFDHYAIYRRNNPSVAPLPQYWIGTSDELTFVDGSIPAGSLYYIVTAIDIHGNQSAQSNVWSPDGATPVGDVPSIRTLTVLGNVPNPFNATTTLRVGLPKASDVSIDIFDVAGRRVRSERVSSVAAGWRDVLLDGRDAGGQTLASGVYFYRVQAGGQTITRKMVIAR